MKPRLYIQLGRVGDILNVLPLCLRDFTQTGIRPVLMVAEPYAPLLDGVTYVEPLIWEGEFEDLDLAFAVAVKVAAERDLAVVPTQIYARRLWIEETCSSFLRDSWGRTPAAPPWGSLPLVFDRRDETRETHVKRQLLKRASPGKPYIVLAMTGTSSPFPFYSELSAYLRNKLSKDFDLVDVSGYIAPRFFDLLTLLQGAHSLLAIDSAVLHLAAAVPKLPVVALITREPSPWHGSAWRPQQVARFFYDESPENCRDIANALIARDVTPRRIFHVSTMAAAPDDETRRRVEFARATWARERMAYPQWVECPFEDEDAFRTSANLGDDRPMPFLSDVIEHANKGTAQDVIAFTNSDVSFVPGISGWILDRMARQECAFTHRRDFARLTTELNSEAEAARGEWYAGSDAFFFTVGWWRRHRGELPDLVLGREQSDEVLRQLIKRHGGLEIPNAIYHEKHASFWEAEGTRNAGNKHNRRLARRWFMRHGYGPNDWLWWALPGGTAPRRVREK
jgi:hypothetical protein